MSTGTEDRATRGEYGLVSVITPTYNCGRFIAETIRSVISQSYADWEMIIVDDMSTDDTREVVERFNDPRIRYIRLERNSGAAVARNRALREARGSWIAFLDSDDLWLPEKLERQLRFMTEHGYAFTYHGYSEIDEESRPLGVTVGGKRCVSRLDMFSCCWPGCLSVMYDVTKIGLIQIADIKKNNDSALWLKAIRMSKCHLLDENLALYRRRKGSITPPGIRERILWHYTLFRTAEGMNPLSAAFWMCMNILGNSYKKLFYVKHEH